MPTPTTTNIVNPGEITINSRLYTVRETKDGWAWRGVARGAAPGDPTPEEARFARTPRRRSLGYMDWSLGSLGPSWYTPGDARMHYSTGPTGADPKTIRRPLKTRTVSIGTEVGAVVDWFEIGDDLYFVQADGYVRKVTLTLNEETVAAAKGVSGTASGDADGIWMNGYGLTEASPRWTVSGTTRVYLGSLAHQLLAFDGDTWTQYSGGGTAAKISRFTSALYDDGTRLWGASQTGDPDGTFLRNLPQGQDPLDDALWSAELFPIPEATAAMNSLVSTFDAVIGSSSDGQVHKFDTTTGLPTPLVHHRSAVANEDAGKQARSWNGVPFIPQPHGLFERIPEGDALGGGTMAGVGPEAIQGYSGPVRGRPSAMDASDGTWLFVAYHNAQTLDSYVYRGRRPRAGENAQQRVIWHPACRVIEGKEVTSLHVSRLGTNPVLCIGTADDTVHFVTLPRDGYTETSDPNCLFETEACDAVLQDQDGNTPTVQKNFWLLRAEAKNCGPENGFRVHIRTNTGDWNLIDTVEESGFVEIPIGPLSGRNVGVRLESFGDDDSLACELGSIEIVYTQRTRPTKWRSVEVVITENQNQGDGREVRTVAERLEFLEDLAGDEQAIEITDLIGATYVAQIPNDPGVEHTVIRHANSGGEPGVVASFQIGLFDDLTPREPAYYDQDSNYDDPTSVYA